jgi:outer membrane receptor protein involved in Fe transport
MFGVTLVPPDHLDHETVYTVEAGYTGQLSEHVDVAVNTYYNRYTDLIGISIINPAPFVGTLANINGADAAGVEAELHVNYKGGRIYAWYAYNDLLTDEPNQEVRSFYPALHSAGIGIRHDLTDTLTFNADYRYTDVTRSSYLGFPVPVANRLDLALTAKVFDGRGELQEGVEDVFNDTVGPIYGISASVSHETPGRTAFIRFQWKF